MREAELARKAEEVSVVLKQMAHPDRLKVLCRLLDGEKTVNEIVEYVGASQPWISQLLSKMKAGGLVISRKDGVFVHYRIAEPRLRTLMTAIYRTYCVASAPKKGTSHDRSPVRRPRAG